MKKTIITIVILIGIFNLQAFAKSNASQKNKIKADLKTEFNFTDSTLRGRYVLPGEGRVNVENEKKLIQLVEARKNFKDRAKQSQEWQK